MYPFPQAMMLGRSMSPEAEALIARMATPPTQYRRFLINKLINDLKAAGVWSNLLCLYLLAAANSQAALLNWISNSHNLTPSGTQVFTADRGMQGNGGSAHLTLDNTSAAGFVGTNDHALGVYMNVDGGAGGYGMGALSTGVTIEPYAGGFLRTKEGGGVVTATVAVATALGYSGMTRTASTGLTLQKNATQTPVTLTSSGFGSGQDYNLLSAPSGFSDCRIAAAHLGPGLTTTQLNALYTAILSYLTAVGGN